MDLRHRDNRATALVHCHPGLGIGDIEVGVRPVHRAGLAVHQHVPFEAFLEIELLLTRDM
ncbi:hypothetical protein D3C80_2223290 [compost metagenome]